MSYKTIDDIYTANRKIRRAFIETAEAISEDEAASIPAGGNWSIGQIVEHVSMVDNGISRICKKLVAAAKDSGATSTGRLAISSEFLEATRNMLYAKLEAPDIVQPIRNAAIPESIGLMKSTTAVYDSLRADLELYDVSEPKIPHPYFGPLTAVEWLALVGYHEERHRKQILRSLEEVRK